MIRYALRCEEEHEWDAWFASIGGYEEQAARGLVACPVCGSTKTRRAPMAPALARSRPAPPAPADAAMASVPPDLSLPAPVRRFFEGWRAHVAANYDYVGDAFAKEVRAMHEGETDERLVYGETTAAEARALIEDGLPVAPLPALASPKAAKSVH
jgi:hypothetical protein